MKPKRSLAVLAALAALLIPAWFFRANLVLACAPYLERKGESGGQWLRDSLISCGPSSIGPTISALRRHSPWMRNYCYLPSALGHFGEPARQQLVTTIDAEQNPRARARLIAALQVGFDDFSRFDLWLTGGNSANPFECARMASDIQGKFPDAPPLEVASQLNPEFIVWWRAHKPK